MGNEAHQLGCREDIRTELLDGKVVAMSPSPAVDHGRIAGNIFNIFSNFLKGKPCEAIADKADVHFSKKDIVIPDMMVVCDANKIKRDGVYGAPDLVVEVLSPSTAARDKGYKKKLYGQHGVKEYWIVEGASRTIEVYLLQNHVLELDNVYTIFPRFMLKKMTDAEKSEIRHTFSPSIFPDMTITIGDVFERLFDNEDY